MHAQGKRWATKLKSKWRDLSGAKYMLVPSDPSEIQGEQEALYAQLDSTARELRLLDIQPAADFDTDVVCKLRTVSLLQDDLHYDALSYAWGESSTRDHIIVNGVFKSVTSNLMLALRHLRNATSVLTLWVDAVSINQDDVSEREQQVCLMREIYRRAAATRAWLGGSSVSNDLAFDFFVYLADTPDAWEFDLPEGVSRAPDHFLDFKEIFQRAWWSRVWVLQEISLASRRYVHCGHRVMTMHDLIEAYRRLKELGTNGLLGLRHETINISHLSDLVSTMAPCLDLLDKLATPPADGDQQGFEFIRLLAMCRESHATDARDKIYGLLGMSPRWVREVIGPNYGLSVEDLYVEIFARLAQRANSTLILSQATLAQSDRSIQGGLPTWAPDWRQQGHRWIDMGLRLEQEKLFNACGQFQDLALSLVHTKGIAVRGLCVGVVINASEKMPQHCEHMDASGCFLNWESFSRTGVSPAVHTEGVNGAFTSAYWKTVLNGAVPNADGRTLLKLQDADLKTFATWRCKNRATQGRQESFLLLTECDRWNDYISSTTRNRRLFMCANGMLGMGPADTQTGDLLFVLAGGTQPYILRAPKRRLDLYSLVGESYVEGIMDGEATLQPPAHLPNLLKGQNLIYGSHRTLLHHLGRVIGRFWIATAKYRENSDVWIFFSPYGRCDFDYQRFDDNRYLGQTLAWDDPFLGHDRWRSQHETLEEPFFEYEINDAGEKVQAIEMDHFSDRVNRLRRIEHRYGDNEKGWRTIVLY